jgi:hypothetical protein
MPSRHARFFLASVLVLAPALGRPDTIEDRLRRHVTHLVRQIGERNVFQYENLGRARDYVKAEWQAQGFSVEIQEYAAAGKACQNLYVTLPGADPAKKPEMVLIGAHYDTAPGTPGADDNASGVAVLLELSRALQNARPARTLRFVAFSTEEPPFFGGPDMGSFHYARAARDRNDRITAMLCLEMVGYYSSARRSQRYPALLGAFYPSTGNFISVVGNLKSMGLVRRVKKGLRRGSSMGVEAAAVPVSMTGVDFSDHRNFWRFGYPAVMLTDTAFYRNPHYHAASDTEDTLDFASMAGLVQGLEAAVLDLTRR